MAAFAEVYIGNAFLPNTDIADFGSLISKVLPWVFWAAGILILIYLLWGGLQFLVSGGDPKRKESARGRMTWALIGFVVIMIAFLIVQFLENWIGITGSIFGTPP